MDGQYCTVTNYKKRIYKGLTCSVTTPNFCFTPHVCSTVEYHYNNANPSFFKMYLSFGVSPNMRIKLKLIYQFFMCILITLMFKTLADKDDTHIIHMNNDMYKTKQPRMTLSLMEILKYSYFLYLNKSCI